MPRFRLRAKIGRRSLRRKELTSYRGSSVIAIVPAYNEESKIGLIVRRTPRSIVDELIVVDDGSTDSTAEVAETAGARVIRLESVQGVGAALRRGFKEALDFDLIVIMAGNNKDSPEEIPILLDPIVEGSADFVQGSRFLKKGASFGDMPLYRKIATRVHPLLFGLVAGKRVSESTNGFRAFSSKILLDERLDLSPAWLDRYELELYLYLRIIKMGYKTTEVPVSKIYPPKSMGQTKIKPITGWWSVLRPLVMVGLRLKK